MTGYGTSAEKRIVERLAAGFLLVAVSPLMLVCAIAIAVTSGWPVFYGDRRVGRAGHEFTLWKFRTMRAAAGPRITAGNDSRITPIGARLRRLKLDELPQLWNVVCGEMSLIGPRPETPEFVDLKSELWSEVLSVAPGMTGAASVVFFDEAERLAAASDPVALYRSRILPEKLAIERQYVRSCSPMLDLELLMQTASRIFRAAGSRAV